MRSRRCTVLLSDTWWTCVTLGFYFCAAFEELERALAAAQRAEEARKQLQVQMAEQVQEVERTSEEERKSLQQELTRVKQEVVTIMKVGSQEVIVFSCDSPDSRFIFP